MICIALIEFIMVIIIFTVFFAARSVVVLSYPSPSNLYDHQARTSWKTAPLLTPLVPAAQPWRTWPRCACMSWDCRCHREEQRTLRTQEQQSFMKNPPGNTSQWKHLPMYILLKHLPMETPSNAHPMETPPYGNTSLWKHLPIETPPYGNGAVIPGKHLHCAPLSSAQSPRRCVMLCPPGWTC